MKDIDKAAREYAERIATSGQFTTSECVQMAKDDFIAGAQSRQSEIDELIEALEEATRWIPVSERLPEEGQEVLGYNPEWIDEDFNQTGVCLCYWNGYPDEPMWFRTKWDNDQDMWWPVEEAPTHWLQKPTIDTPKATQLLGKYGKK